MTTPVTHRYEVTVTVETVIEAETKKDAERIAREEGEKFSDKVTAVKAVEEKS